jgi:pimeloyl-ACP methyl ester carboxylesterase
MIRANRSMSERLRSVGILVLSAPALALASTAPAQALPSDGPRTDQTTCSKETISVKGDGLLPRTYTVAGALCGKEPANKQILLITAHGATYNRLYWDWPQNPAEHSFVRNQDARVSVLNIDLLGSGASSRPLSVNVTMQAQASMLNKVVRAMRARGFQKVILVGHSSGSGVITLAASTYGNVDGLIVTGFLHRFAAPVPPPGGLAVPLSLYPAAIDPAFSGMNLDPGYLTTRPGTRANPGFYNGAVADPDVITYDDAHKDIVTATHVAGFVAIVNDPRISQAVNVPVLSLVGSHDGGFCDSPACPQAAEEPAAWSPGAQLELHVIPNAGHNIHLHGTPYAKTEYAYVREWLDRRF